MHYGNADAAREQRDLSIEISRLNDEIQRLSLSPRTNRGARFCSSNATS